jgi:hypothetical protein
LEAYGPHMPTCGLPNSIIAFFEILKFLPSYMLDYLQMGNLLFYFSVSKNHCFLFLECMTHILTSFFTYFHPYCFTYLNLSVSSLSRQSLDLIRKCFHDTELTTRFWAMAHTMRTAQIELPKSRSLIHKFLHTVLISLYT